MSADSRQAEALFRVAVIWGLFGFGGIVIAEESQAPDLELLEYLGSWEESDEDWMIFAAETETKEDSENGKEGKDPAPNGEKVAELDDEQ